MTSTVERVHDISVEELRREYAEPGRPVVISRCIEHWPARKKWSLDYFADRFGDKTLDFSEKKWTLRDFVAELRSGKKPAPYLNQVKLDEQFLEALRRHRRSEIYARERALQPLPSALDAHRPGHQGALHRWRRQRLRQTSLGLLIPARVHLPVVGSKDFMIFSPETRPTSIRILNTRPIRW